MRTRRRVTPHAQSEVHWYILTRPREVGLRDGRGCTRSGAPAPPLTESQTHALAHPEPVSDAVTGLNEAQAALSRLSAPPYVLAAGLHPFPLSLVELQGAVWEVEGHGDELPASRPKRLEA